MIGAGFGGRLHQRARDIAELRVVVARGDFEFFKASGFGYDY